MLPLGVRSGPSGKQFPLGVRIGPSGKQYNYRRTDSFWQSFPVYQCDKAADGWAVPPDTVLYLIRWGQGGWKAVHHGVNPRGVENGEPVFSTFENALASGWHKWFVNRAGAGQQPEWEIMAEVETVELWYQVDSL